MGLIFAVRFSAKLNQPHFNDFSRFFCNSLAVTVIDGGKGASEVQLTLRIMIIKTSFKMHITLVNKMLALTSVHSSFYRYFRSELSFKSIYNHTAATVSKEGKPNLRPPGYPMSQGYKWCRKVGVLLSYLEVLFTRLLSFYRRVRMLAVG